MEPNSLLVNQEETVYGDETVGSEASETSSDVAVVSDRIQSLANSVYQEFESSINQYGEDSVKNLMPLVVNILESLNQQCTEKQDLDVELDLIRDDNQQLISQYEREKQLRKSAEERILKLEDNFDEGKKELTGKIESLESIVRMLELKSRNAQDHAARLEDKETELKRENSKLHERNRELFRSHMDYIERTKMMGSDGRLHSTSVDPQSPGVAMSSSLGPSRIRSSFPIPGPHRDGQQLKEDGSSHAVSQLPGDAINSNDLHHEIQQQLSQEAGDAVRGKFGDTDESFQELTMSECPAEASGDEGGNDSADDQDIDSEFGMHREIEILIKENQELIETKNALNVVKDDLITQVDDLTSENTMLREEINSLDAAKTRYRQRIHELEQEMRELRQTCEEYKRKAESHADEDDESLPIAQRRRFTRIEMARVLMEKNNYKERLMELQEAVRWAEMIRASREHPDIMPTKRRSLLERFSTLLRSNNKPKPSTPAHSQLHYGASGGGSVRPYNSDRSKRMIESMGMPEEKTRAYDFLHEDHHRCASPVRARQSSMKSTTWMKKDTNRKQAYGWSIPNKGQTSLGMVPIPIYCRPLSAERQPGVTNPSLLARCQVPPKPLNMSMLCCACCVNLTGARTREGNNVVGTSIFYRDEGQRRSSEPVAGSEVEKLSQQLKAHCDAVQASMGVPEGATSLVWICSSGHSHSQLTVIDANHPADILDSFYVTKSHLLCLGAVPGAAEEDYGDSNGSSVEDDTEEKEGSENAEPEATADALSVTVTQVKCSVEETPEGADDADEENVKVPFPYNLRYSAAGDPLGAAPEEAIKNRSTSNATSTTTSHSTPTALTSLQPTMWLGCQSGHIFVHSTVANWRKCLHTVKLNESVLSIVHVQGRVFIGLADGTIAVFGRDSETGEWNLASYRQLNLGRPQHAVRCITAVADKNLWIGYQNQILIMDASRHSSLTRLKHRIEAHPRSDFQVRQMCWTGDGVWISIRPDATLRLFHAYTFEHLQDLDVEPHVTKMIDSSKLGFSLVRLTSLMVSSGRLWIGTGNGVILTAPFNHTSDELPPGAAAEHKPKVKIYEEGSSSTSAAGEEPDGRKTEETSERAIAPATFLPLVNPDDVHMSFHGHRDIVKFFVAVPGNLMPLQNKEGKPQRQSSFSSSPQRVLNSILMMSGGEGYVDFRNVPDSEQSGGSVDKVNLSRNERSYLIVWQIFPSKS